MGRIFLISVAVLVVLSAVLLGCGRAGGGSDGWVSSGGELYQGRQNPWWLSNVKEVGYCVVVDRATSSVDPTTAQTLVAEALRYWRNEFERGIDAFFRPTDAADMSFPFGIRLKESLGVATQKFVPGPCATAKLRVLVGSGALTTDERAYLESALSRLLAAAVRTDYDEESLTGRGFIYIASDRGKDVPKPLQIAEHKGPGDPQVFLSLVAHELGHVFGIPHVGVRTSLMADRFPETLLTLHRYAPEGQKPWIPSFFGTPMGFLECGENDKLASAGKFFGVEFGDQGVGCPSFSYMLDGKSVMIEAANVERKTRVKLGTLQDLNKRNDYAPALTVELFPGQRVFEGLASPDLLIGPPFLRASTIYGKFVSADGKKESPMVFSIDAAGCWRQTVAAVLDGKLTPIFRPGYSCF